MKVTVITPFYEGNAYMPQYQEVIRKNRASLGAQDSLEAVLVNDSPWVQPELTLSEEERDWWHVISNDENCGIHASRLRGLEQAGGEYVMFLDQDDTLSDHALAHMLSEVRSRREGSGAHTAAFVVVSNAVLEQEHGSALWYRTKYHMQQVGRLSTYLRVGTQIISPGQCLIPAARIPADWKQYVCRNNGADDYYLWLLMLYQGTSFFVTEEALYTHRYTARNLSADTEVTDRSGYEFIRFLRESSSFPNPYADTLERMLRYKASFRKASAAGKIGVSLCHPILFASNLLYKIRTKTPYGFHR